MNSISLEQDRRWHRFFVKGALIILGSLILIAVIFFIFGESFVESIYMKTSFGVLNKLIHGQDEFPLQHYLVFAEMSFKGLILFMVLFFPVCFGLLFGWKKEIFSKFLWIMLWADICLIILNVTHQNLWILNRDFFIPELFLYLQELLIVVFCFLFFIRKKQKIFLVFTLIFLVIFFDDSFSIHERMGYFLSDKLNLVSISEKVGTYASYHIGEFLFLGITGGILALFFFIVYQRSNDPSCHIAMGLFKLLLLFAFFAVIVDLFHGMTALRGMYDIIGIIENGGEMIVGSLMFVYAFKHYVLFQIPPDALGKH